MKKEKNFYYIEALLKLMISGSEFEKIFMHSPASNLSANLFSISFNAATHGAVLVNCLEEQQCKVASKA